MSILFKAHLFLALYLTGLIWFVQVVHYPLMGKVGKAYFVAYENAHTRLTSWVTAPPMLLELGTGATLLYLNPGLALFQVNLIAIVLIWASTFFIQVPLHGRLSSAFSEAAHRKLVRSNWIRTVLWTGKGALLLWWV